MRRTPPKSALLTPREQEVLDLLREQLSNEEIAARLDVSVAGVKYHVSEILGKLGLENRHDAARWAERAAAERRPWWAGAFAPLAALWRKLPGLAAAGNAIAFAAGAVVLAAVGGLAGLLILTRGDGDGSPEVDELGVILDAIASADPAALEPLIRLGSTPCLRGEPDRPIPSEVEPLCLEGEPTGTLIDTFWVASCVGLAPERSTVAGRAEWIVDQELESLYGVYEPQPNALPSAQFVAVYERQAVPEHKSGFAVFVDSGWMIGADYDCGFPPDEMVELMGLGSPLPRD